MSRSWRVEVWEAQSYWAIKGWCPPLAGEVPFWSNLLPGNRSDVLPTTMPAPPGWEWNSEWEVDLGDTYGKPDADGWYTASSFERLNEQLRSGTCTPAANSNAARLVRKRCWLRTLRCSSSSNLEQQITHRVAQIRILQRQIESETREKQSISQAVHFYDDNRAFLFSQSLFLATHATLNSLQIMRELENRLRRLQEYFHDRASIEREYAMRLQWLAKKHTSRTIAVADEELPPFTPEDNTPSSPKVPKKSTISSLFQSPKGVVPEPPQTPEPVTTKQELTPFSPSIRPQRPSVKPSELLPCAELFFSRLASLAESQSSFSVSFSATLCEQMCEAIDGMADELANCRTDARQTFESNINVCRLTEDATTSSAQQVGSSFESVLNSSIAELEDLRIELAGLEGTVPFNPKHFSRINLVNAKIADESSSSACDDILDKSSIHCVSIPSLQNEILVASANGSMSSLNSQNDNSTNDNPFNNSSVSLSDAMSYNSKVSDFLSATPRKDLWLAVHRYRLNMNSSQEALCVLISESMDLELRQQILSNRVHNFFVKLVNTYSHEEERLYREISSVWMKQSSDFIEEVNKIGPPHPVLQSPFQRLQEPSSHDANVLNTGNYSVLGGEAMYDDFVNGAGIFSFTNLYKDPPPRAPGVVRSAKLKFAPCPSSDTDKDSIVWKETHVIATSDGYLHLLPNPQNPPEASFYVSHCILNSSVTIRQWISEFSLPVFDVMYAKNARESGLQAITSEGIMLLCDTVEERNHWINDLLQLTMLPTAEDTALESIAAKALTDSLPILRGETEKIELTLRLHELGPASPIASPVSNEVTNIINDIASVDLFVDEPDESSEQDVHVTEDASPLKVEDPNEESTPKEEEDDEVDISSQPSTQNRNKGGKIERKVSSLRAAFENNYRRDENQKWVKSGTDTEPFLKARRSSVIGAVPISHDVTVKRMIPNADRSLPLARRHSVLIAQYEQGLNADAEKSLLKITESRQQRIAEVFESSTESNSPPPIARALQVPLEELPNNRVRNMSQLFDAAVAAINPL